MITPSLRPAHALRSQRAILLVGFLALASPARAGTIHEDLKMLPSDGTTGDRFGQAVAIDDGHVAVGAPFGGENGLDSGVAYLVHAATGVERFKLVPGDGSAGDQFGGSIAMADGVVAVGARLRDDNGPDSGAAYLFNAATGEQIAKLLPDDGAAGDEFGHSIAIAQGIVAVGAMRDDDRGNDSGSAYLFDASTGEQLAKLAPAEGAANQNFGVSIAMDAGLVAVGARTYYVHGTGFFLGAVHLFDATTGDEIDKLMADNGTYTDMFADAVDIDDGIVAVGAWGRSVFYDHSGAAYLFDAASGSQLAYIVPADGHDRDHFGTSVSIDGGVVAIGAHNDGDMGWQAGSAYLYDATDGTLIDKLLVSDGAAFDRFGSAIAISHGVVAAGAIGYGSSGTETGYVALFGSGRPTGVESGRSWPDRIAMPAQPNPFNPRTTLRFALPTAAAVRLGVYTVSGRQVATLVDEDLPAGDHSAAWTGRDAAGRALPSGVYFARLQVAGQVTTTKLVLTR